MFFCSSVFQKPCSSVLLSFKVSRVSNLLATISWCDWMARWSVADQLPKWAHIARDTTPRRLACATSVVSMPTARCLRTPGPWSNERLCAISLRRSSTCFPKLWYGRIGILLPRLVLALMQRESMREKNIL